MKAAIRLMLLLALVAPSFASAQTTALPTCRLTASATTVPYNTRVRLDWTSTNATTGFLTDVGVIGPNGFAFVVPGKNTTYAASFTGPGGSVVCRVGISVQPGATPLNGGSFTTGVDQTAPLNTPTNTTNTGFPVTETSATSPIPQSSSGFGGLVPQECRGGNTVKTCDLCSLAQMTQNVANFLLGLTIPAAALLFAYAGALYFSARGKETQITQAHKVFRSVVIGFIIALCAWTLIITVMNGLIHGANFQGWNWKELNCTQTRQLRQQMIDRKVSDYINSSLPGLQAYTPPIGTATGGLSLECSNGVLMNGGCYTTEGGYLGQPVIVDGTNSGNILTCGDNWGVTYRISNGQCLDENDNVVGSATYTGTREGRLSDDEIETLNAACTAGDPGSCDRLMADLAVPDSPTQVGRGDCSPSALESDWGDSTLSRNFSCIAQRESTCRDGLSSRSDVTADGQSFSIGRYQVNMSVHSLTCEDFNNGNPVNCPAAFNGTNFRATIRDQNLYNTCRTMLQDVGCNTQMAHTIYANEGYRAWSTAAACGL